MSRASGNIAKRIDGLQARQFKEGYTYAGATKTREDYLNELVTRCTAEVTKTEAHATPSPTDKEAVGIWQKVVANANGNPKPEAFAQAFRDQIAHHRKEIDQLEKKKPQTQNDKNLIAGHSIQIGKLENHPYYKAAMELEEASKALMATSMSTKTLDSLKADAARLAVLSVPSPGAPATSAIDTTALETAIATAEAKTTTDANGNPVAGEVPPALKQAKELADAINKSIDNIGKLSNDTKNPQDYGKLQEELRNIEVRTSQLAEQLSSLGGRTGLTQGGMKEEDLNKLLNECQTIQKQIQSDRQSQLGLPEPRGRLAEMFGIGNEGPGYTRYQADPKKVQAPLTQAELEKELGSGDIKIEIYSKDKHKYVDMDSADVRQKMCLGPGETFKLIDVVNAVNAINERNKALGKDYVPLRIERDGHGGYIVRDAGLAASPTATEGGTAVPGSYGRSNTYQQGIDLVLKEIGEQRKARLNREAQAAAVVAGNAAPNAANAPAAGAVPPAGAANAAANAGGAPPQQQQQQAHAPAPPPQHQQQHQQQQQQASASASAGAGASSSNASSTAPTVQASPQSLNTPDQSKPSTPGGSGFNVVTASGSSRPSSGPSSNVVTPGKGGK